MLRFVLLIFSFLILPACIDSNNSTFFSKRPSGLLEGCPENMQCAYLSVPKDYQNEDSKTVDVYYGVHKALDEENRIGILVLNFGGPSAEAVWGASYMAEYYLPDEIVDRFDIVGIDPRGSGQSAFAKQLTNCAIDEYDNGNSCLPTYLEVAPYLGSNSVVKDIDRLREHLGEEKLNFLGYSYGTRLGSLYTQAFPDNVRAIILDSSMPPKSDNYLELQLESAAGYDLIADFRLDFNRDNKQKYEQLFTDINNNDSYTAVDGTTFDYYDYSVLQYATSSPEDNGDWQTVKNGVYKWLDEDSATLLKEEIDSISIPLIESNDDLRANVHFRAVVCTDESKALSESDIAASRSTFETTSKIFGLDGYYGAYLCADWQVQRDPITTVENMEQVLTDQQILIIGGQYDTATPYLWAQEMVTSFGERAALITVDNWVSHGFSYDDNDCIDDKVTQYLLDPSIKIGNVTCDGSLKNEASLSRSIKKIQHPAHQQPGQF